MISSPTDEANPLTVEPLGSGAGIGVSGEVDLSNGARMRQEIVRLLPAAGGGRVALDLSALTFFGSAGICALLESRDIAEQRGIRLVISRAHENVRVILTVCELADLFGLPPASSPGE